MSRQFFIRQLVEKVKNEAEKETEKGINKPRSTIRHLEATEDGTVTKLLTGLPTYSHEVE